MSRFNGGSTGLTQNATALAATLLERGDFDGLRVLLANTFEVAGCRVSMMPAAEYARLTGNLRSALISGQKSLRN